jgi:hypothetical protein
LYALGEEKPAMTAVAAAAYTFKIPTEPGEFAQIHRLNYETFVREIPQHPTDASGPRVDPFHAENTYLICLRSGGVLAGMVAVRATRPFSLDAKLAGLDAYLPPHQAVCEIRLLAVARPFRRGGRVFRGLAAHLSEHCRARGWDLAVISGTTRQERLYRRLGFVPFGPLVGPPGARYQPMYLTRDALERRARPLLALEEEGEVSNTPRDNEAA